MFSKFGEKRLEFFKKRMHSLVNEENYYNMEYIKNNI